MGWAARHATAAATAAISQWWEAPRVAIVGTAPSWKLTPWNDPEVVILGLNDGYMLGMPKANAWFDLHPIEKFWYRPKARTVLDLAEIPPGVYVRPEGHLEWLQQQATRIPVYLQSVPEGWPPHAQRFPIEEVQDYLHGYIASGPSMMIALAMLKGVQRLEIYGIHLATEQEYVEQRPNFEQVLGRFLGAGRVTLRLLDGMRHYESEAGPHLVLPVASPILQHSRRYAYDPRPLPAPEAVALDRRLAQLTQYQQTLVRRLVHQRWYERAQPSRRELERITLKLQDVHEQRARLTAASSQARTIEVRAPAPTPVAA